MGGAYDPSVYLKDKPAETAPAPDAAVESHVVLNGVRYRRFSSDFGAILVPDLTHVDKAMLEAAACEAPRATTIEKCFKEDPFYDECMKRREERERADGSVTVARAETRLSANVKAYAEAILTTIRRKCGYDPAPAPQKLDIRPELGIEFKDEHKRNPTTYKVYTPGLGKALGFKSEF